MRVGGRRNVFWHGGLFVVLATAAQPSQKISGPKYIITLTPQAVIMRLSSDSIWNVILFYKYNLEQCTSVDIHSKKICFLAVIQHLNIHQKCSCAAMCMSLFICYLSEDCFSMCAHWLSKCLFYIL